MFRFNMTQKELERDRKEIGLRYKKARLFLMRSAREIVEASDNTLTLKTIYKFEAGGSSHGDTRIIYKDALQKLGYVFAEDVKDFFNDKIEIK